MADEVDDDPFENIHRNGVNRHPHSWFGANLAAINAARESGMDSYDSTGKVLISRIVLRVLDFTDAP